MTDHGKPNYSWDWVNGMHIGYTPERIRVEGRGGAVEYVPDTGTCRNVSEDQDKFECSECGFEMPIWDGDGCWMAFYHCPYCGCEVVDK